MLMIEILLECYLMATIIAVNIAGLFSAFLTKTTVTLYAANELKLAPFLLQVLFRCVFGSHAA